MQIQEFAQMTNLPANMVRFCEEIGLLPLPSKLDNGYPDYSKSDFELARFIATARSLGFSLVNIQEILAIRDQRTVPSNAVMDLMIEKANEISLRIAELQEMEAQLQELHQLGTTIGIASSFFPYVSS